MPSTASVILRLSLRILAATAPHRSTLYTGSAPERVPGYRLLEIAEVRAVCARLSCGPPVKRAAWALARSRSKSPSGGDLQIRDQSHSAQSSPQGRCAPE